jgi:hypothetical protein
MARLDHRRRRGALVEPTSFAYPDAMARYAAYATNLDPQRMRVRAPYSPVAGTGWLIGWRLTFGGEDLNWDGSLATIVEEPLSSVFVMLYEVSDLDERRLDEWEGSALGIYDKIRVRVQTLDGDQVAWTYVLNDYEGGLPSEQYLADIAAAAAAAGAPDDYVAELRARPTR